MLTKDEAAQKLSLLLREKSNADDPLEIVEGKTRNESFGWVFFYNSKKFLETGEAIYRIAGNGPVIFNKFTEEIKFCSSSEPVEQSIKVYGKVADA